MEHVIVTYKVKPETVEENERLIKAVYDELREKNDPDIHYATFKKDDGVTFVHIFFAPQEKKPLLSESASFKAFQEHLKERCEIPPQPETLTKIDGFQLG